MRGQKEAIEAEAKEKVADIKANLLKLEAWLKEKMDADGETSKKTAFGTAFITTTDFAQVGDWDAVLGFIQKNEAWDMLEKESVRQQCVATLKPTKLFPMVLIMAHE